MGLKNFLRGSVMASFATLLAVGAANSETLKVATEASYPPYSQTQPDGSITGFEIDLGNAVCKRLNVTCEWVKQDFDGIIAGLLAKKYNVIFSSMAITDERKKTVDFSIAYYGETYHFVGARGIDVTISKEGLMGKTVGVQGGAVTEQYIEATYGDVVKIRGYPTPDERNADLVAGRIDLGFASSLILLEFLKIEQGQKFQLVGPAIIHKEILGAGVGAVFRKGYDELRERFNKAIREVYADGTFDDIAAKYFPSDVTVRGDTLW